VCVCAVVLVYPFRIRIMPATDHKYLRDTSTWHRGLAISLAFYGWGNTRCQVVEPIHISLMHKSSHLSTFSINIFIL